MPLTITEALAEVKTLDKRITKKRDFIYQNLTRSAKLRDPLEKDGGSKKAVERELQAIEDLQARIVAIRCLIQKANLDNTLDVEGKTRTVAEWLAYRREVSEKQAEIYQHMNALIQSARNRQRRENEATEDLEVSVSEQGLFEKMENHEIVMSSLDGKLSLFNATRTIEI